MSLRLRSLVVLATAVALFTGCGKGAPPATPEPGGTSARPSGPMAAFVNGDFENDPVGTTPPSGWTVLNYLNAAGVSGTAAAPPSTFAALNLSGLGTAVNETFTVGGNTLSQVDPDLGAGQPFRYPIYASRSVRVNYKDASAIGKNKNSNLIRQSMTIGLADIDPGDGLAHVRFVVAPVLENPSHAFNQQPYFFIELLNLTRGTTLYTGFNVAGQAGVPWKTTTSLVTGNAVQWLDWQLVDLSTAGSALSIGDQVQLTVVASGCSLGGHFGRIYVDGMGTTIPGPYVTASAPGSVNAGATLTYTLRYANGGATPAVGAHVDMVTPPSTTFASTAGLAGCTTPAAGTAGTISCPLGTLNPGAAGTFTVTVNVAAGATGSIVNGTYSIGAVTAPTLLGMTVKTTVNGSGTRYADIVVTKAASVTSVTAGQVFTAVAPLYTITVTNTSTTDQIRASLGKSFTLTDVMPATLTGATWACTVLTQGSLQTGATATKCRDGSGGTGYNGTGNVSLSPRLGYNGGKIQIVVYGTISGGATGQVVNTVAASAPTGITDPNLANNTATVTLPVGTPRSLSITKAGTGTGTVASTPAGISCGATCSTTLVQGSQVLLTASPIGGASFTGWAGAAGCSTATTCLVTLGGSNLTVTATFTAAPAPSAPASVYVYGGSGQRAPTATAFAAPLQALVTDAAGTALSGVVVTWTAPGPGASAGLGTGTATTNAFGVASLAAIANATPGTYPVSASVSGVATPATFTLTNVGPPASVTYVNGGNPTDPQLAPINAAFNAPLVALVTDAAGNPIPGATVTYTAVPAGGATATLSGGAACVPAAAGCRTAITDASGYSSVTATANGTVGAYTVTASVAGVATPATFSLQNVSTGPAAIFVVGGTPQLAPTSAPFGAPLVVVVADASGNSLPGITVTWAATTVNGATASLSAGTAVTNASGVASITATANGNGGIYAVNATVTGVPTPATFSLTNDAGSSIQVQSGSPQTATISTSFAGTLQVLVLDGTGTGAANQVVTFQAPTSGATATLSGGAACVPAAAGCRTATTAASGLATLSATANGTAGTYAVVATTPNAPGSAVFDLTNQCTASSQCSGTAPICSGAPSACVACTSDAACAAKDASRPWCDVSGACFACLDDAQCAVATAPICSQATNTCGGCTTDAQCANRDPLTPACIVGTGACVPTFTVSGSAGANGSITPSGPQVVVQGTSLTFTITPAANYHVADVLVDGASVGAVGSYSFTNVTAAHTIAASFAIDTRTITASAGANGSITPIGAVSVNYGSAQAFTITPAANYHVLDVLVDGLSVGAVGTYTFTNVTAAHTIAASFAIDTRTITASAGANGSISPSGAVTVNYGSTQAFTITPAANYHVLDVLVDGLSVGAVGSYTFTSVTAAHTIAASFAIDTRTITASAGANGSITPSGAVTVNYGSAQAFTITPAANYHVLDVLVDGLSVGAVGTYTFTNVTAAHTIAASFAIDTRTITASAGANGSISPSGAVSVNYGSAQAFTITPAANYHVADVLVDGLSVGAVGTYTFTNVTAAHTIAASFAIDTRTITASAGANGSISPSGAVSVNYGASQAFTITPAANYHVADVLVDGLSVGAVGSYSFTSVSAAHTIAASFAIDTRTITASAGANGSISPSGAVSVNYGASQAFTITPAANYHVADVLVDGASVGAVGSYTFTSVSAAHTIAASFAIDTRTITASAGANGAISPSGAVTVNYGASQAFTITPAANYHVADVLVDGLSVGAVGSYSFTSVSAAHTIAASFAIDTRTITASAGANGSISPSGAVTVNYGSTQAFTITPAANYHVLDVLVDGLSVGAVGTYTFTSVTSAHTIAAMFAVDRYTFTVTPATGGTVTCPALVDFGQPATCTVTPDPGWVLATFTDDGVDRYSAALTGSYVVASVTANHAVVATFTRGAGTACSGDGDCATGHCTDGVCCDAVCGGQCQACDVSGLVGQCTTVTGQPHGARTTCATDGSACGGTCDGSLPSACTYPTSSCRDASCDPASGTASAAASCSGGSCPAAQLQACAPYACGPTACLPTCANDSQCVSGDWCSGGSCLPRVADGSACTTGAQCTSGSCADGVCCNTACGGQCEACNLAGLEGTCTPVTGTPVGARAACGSDGSACGGACNGVVTASCTYPIATCRAASCAGGTATVAAACDGAGSCPAPQLQACAPYACGATACLGGCGVDADCAAGNFCSAGVCVATIANGIACSADTQCASAHCTDGVCCDSACGGQCEACTVAGHLGACTPVTGAPAGARAACASDGTSCGGACDGSSPAACAYPTATCRGASCAAGAATLSAACDGAGSCPAPQAQNCAPYACDAAGTACLGDCTADSDCAAGRYCSAGLCIDKQPVAASCAADGQCASGFCTDGVCCDSACGGQCEACTVAGLVGTCTPVVGSPLNARTACATDGSSCGGACDGASRVACRYPTDACRPGACSAGVATLADACDGAGHCPAPRQQTCVPYLCGATACAGTCVDDAGCVAGDWCSGGVCVPRLGDGLACSGDGQCQNGHCVDGLCCDGACGGQCEACDLAGRLGQCSAVTGLPRGGRAACATDGSACGGQCDGAARTACAFPGTGTTCRTGSCTGGAVTPASSCDGGGACLTPSSNSCGAYACSGATCATSCSSSAGCAPGQDCVSGSCLPAASAGALHVRGSGGCSSAGAGELAPLGLLALLALFRRRRRTVGGAVLLMALVLAWPARAATVDAIEVTRFQPLGGTNDLLGVASARLAGDRAWQLGLLVDYANQPLRLEGSGGSVALVEHATNASLSGTLGWTDRWELSLVVPVTLAASGQPASDLVPGLVLETPSAGLGDLRVTPRFGIGSAGGVAWAVLLPLTFPTATAPYAGQGTFSASLRAAAEYRAPGGWRLDANLGVVVRQAQEFVDISQQTALTYALGGEVPFPGGRWSALATATGEVASGRAEQPAELLLAACYRTPSGLAVTAGGGPGLSDGYGTPRYRVLAGVSWTAPARPAPAPPPPPVPAARTPPPPAEPPAMVAATAPSRPAVAAPPVPPAAMAPAAAVAVAAPQPQVRVEKARIVTLKQIQFATASDLIEPASNQIVDEVAAALVDNPAIDRLRIEGHTDDRGGAARNLDLSNRRAARVRKALVQRGIAPGRLESKGYGQTRPIAPNTTEAGRQANRRVEFIIVKQAGAGP